MPNIYSRTTHKSEIPKLVFRYIIWTMYNTLLLIKFISCSPGVMHLLQWKLATSTEWTAYLSKVLHIVNSKRGKKGCSKVKYDEYDSKSPLAPPWIQSTKLQKPQGSVFPPVTLKLARTTALTHPKSLRNLTRSKILKRMGHFKPPTR